jgi:hypothetical protein
MVCYERIAILVNQYNNLYLVFGVPYLLTAGTHRIEKLRLLKRTTHRQPFYLMSPGPKNIKIVMSWPIQIFLQHLIK